MNAPAEDRCSSDDDQEECFRLSEELAANYRGVDIYIRSGKYLDISFFATSLLRTTESNQNRPQISFTLLCVPAVQEFPTAKQMGSRLEGP